MDTRLIFRDYRNSIKESISAVEAMARLVAENPKATLADALKAIERRGALHGPDAGESIDPGAHVRFGIAQIRTDAHVRSMRHEDVAR